MVQAGKVWVLSVEDIVAQHRDIIARSGGEQGVLNLTLLQAAVERAKQGSFRSDGGIMERTAFILRGIAQDHPFIDGNKRTALLTIATVQGRNGFYLDESPTNIVAFILHVATAYYSLEKMISWLRTRARKV